MPIKVESVLFYGLCKILYCLETGTLSSQKRLPLAECYKLAGRQGPPPPAHQAAPADTSPICRSVCSAQECMTLVGAGLQLRATRATAVHAHSSPSHLIITVTLTTAPCCDSAGKWPFVQSQLHIIEIT